GERRARGRCLARKRPALGVGRGLERALDRRLPRAGCRPPARRIRLLRGSADARRAGDRRRAAAAGRPAPARRPAHAAGLGPRVPDRAAGRGGRSRHAAPRGRSPRSLPVRRRDELLDDASCARPGLAHGPARSTRRIRAGAPARDHRAARARDAFRPRGRQAMNLCLFDLDHTLIPLDSDHAWGDFIVRIGWADADGFKRGNDVFYEQYRDGTLDIHAYIDFATSPWRSRPAQELAAAQARFMREVIEPGLHPQALELVEEHRRLGDRIAIVTATNDFITAPIARAFGVDELIA